MAESATPKKAPRSSKRGAVIAALGAGNSTVITAVTIGVGVAFVRGIQKEVFGGYSPEKNSSRTIRKALQRRAAERIEQLRLLAANGGHGRASQAMAEVQKRDGCRWPIGSSENPDFRFCGKKRLSHKSYCAACNERAYLKGHWK